MATQAPCSTIFFPCLFWCNRCLAFQHTIPFFLSGIFSNILYWAFAFTCHNRPRSSNCSPRWNEFDANESGLFCQHIWYKVLMPIFIFLIILVGESPVWRWMEKRSPGKCLPLVLHPVYLIENGFNVVKEPFSCARAWHLTKRSLWYNEFACLAQFLLKITSKCWYLHQPS